MATLLAVKAHPLTSEDSKSMKREIPLQIKSTSYYNN